MYGSYPKTPSLNTIKNKLIKENRCLLTASVCAATTLCWNKKTKAVKSHTNKQFSVFRRSVQASEERFAELDRRSGREILIYLPQDCKFPVHGNRKACCQYHRQSWQERITMPQQHHIHQKPGCSVIPINWTFKQVQNIFLRVITFQLNNSISCKLINV